jgi:hypothetical protein
MMATAAQDPKAAALVEEMTTRRTTPPRLLAPMVGRMLATQARRLVA